LEKDETTLQEYMSTAIIKTVCCHKRAKIAIAARTKKSLTSEKLIADRECKKLDSGIAFIRRYAISYQFTKYGSPPESTWAKIGLVKYIMKELNKHSLWKPRFCSKSIERFCEISDDKIII
jgi:hypothetical protein